MSISRIQNNISASNANRNLNVTSAKLSKNIERLSSGLRINRAGDDAAGLSVANRLRTQTQGLNQAVTNASDGINLINVAEGALDETTTRLNRIRTLAVTAANTSVNDSKARSAIQDEVFQSIDEISRIANTTQFGGNFLLNGDFAISTDTIQGQQQVGLSVDASPVASTLKSGKSFLNIIKVQDGSAQIVAGDAAGGPQIVNTGIRNQSDLAVSTAFFTQAKGVTSRAVSAGTAVLGGATAFFNGVSIQNTATAADIFVFDGVLADGVTKFQGSLSLKGASTVQKLVSTIQVAINNTEKAMFGVSTVNSIATAFHTKVTMGTGANLGRIVLKNQGEYVSESSINMTQIRKGNIVTRTEGVTRSGALGIDSALSGTGMIGNTITAITGSTFGAGSFNIEIYDVQSAQQRKMESTVTFRDGNGAILNRTTSLKSSNASNTIVLNGTFVAGNYTGGVSMVTGDTITLTGINSDGTTFQSTFTYDKGTASVDTALNDFKFISMSGLVKEMNYRTRSYSGGSATTGDQTRFENALFTFTTSGSLMLVDDMAKSDSKTDFTLTFQNKTANSIVNPYTLQDKATLKQEGFAEQATFRVDGGTEVRAEAGEVVTLQGKKSTVEGVAQPQVTFRVGNSLSAGIDKLETNPDQFTGALNGGLAVTFSAGDQNVVFTDGNSGGNKGVARFVTIDFNNIIDVTARKDGLPDAGRTILLSTTNNSLNFHIGAYADQSFKAAIGNMTAENLGFGKGSGRAVKDIDVTTVEGANDGIRILDEALDQINKTRSILGSSTNRLEAAVSNLSVSSENLSASESRIRDVDIARESTDYTKNQVLLQAGVSVLAQANTQPQGFLSLLR